MQDDGNLVLYNKEANSEIAIWSTGTYGNCNAYALVQDDGNFVVYRGKDSPSNAIWKTGTNILNAPTKC